VNTMGCDCEFHYDQVNVTSFIITKYGTLPLKAFSKEQRSVARFLGVKELSANDIHS